jgi:multidrug transporter EmrE-like cation transporter
MISSRVIFMENIPGLRYFGILLIIIGIFVSSLAKS